MQSVKHGEKYLYFSKYCLYFICKSGAVVESWALDPKIDGLRSALIYSTHDVSGIENGICSLRCIERKIRSILQTEYMQNTCLLLLQV